MDNGKLFPTLLLVTATFIPLNPAKAATLIESQSEDGGAQQIWVDKQNVRINTDNGDYLLYLGNKNKMYMISSREKEIMDISMNNDSSTTDSAAKIKIHFKHEGSGPKYVGYTTKKYVLTANDVICSTSYTSKKALQDSNLVTVINAMQKASALGNIMKHAGNLCDQAGILALKEYKKLGLPLYSVQENGKKISRITKIQKNAKLPQGGFTLPQNYKTTSLQQKMQQAMPPQGMPDMPPEVREMMKKMREQGNH